MNAKMNVDWSWIRAHLPKELADRAIGNFNDYYLDGLKIVSEGERGGPDNLEYEARDEEDLRL